MGKAEVLAFAHGESHQRRFRCAQSGGKLKKAHRRRGASDPMFRAGSRHWASAPIHSGRPVSGIISQSFSTDNPRAGREAGRRAERSARAAPAATPAHGSSHLARAGELPHDTITMLSTRSRVCCEPRADCPSRSRSGSRHLSSVRLLSDLAYKLQLGRAVRRAVRSEHFMKPDR